MIASPSFRDDPRGPGPESLNTYRWVVGSSLCSWVPGSRALPAPRNDTVPTPGATR
jgi:hypothetical protein